MSAIHAEDRPPAVGGVVPQGERLRPVPGVPLFDELDAGELSIRFEGEKPQALIEWALAEFEQVAISTAFQVDGSVVIDMAYEIDPNVRVFTIDTGRLPQESLGFAETLRKRYPGIELEVMQPDPEHVRRMVEAKGPDHFRESVENRLLCCQVRKVQPLLRQLDGLDAWITGLRRDQWATRTNIRKVEIDHDHGAMVKLNPLAEWTARDVWTYLRERDVPIHPLYARGFTSIGCEPCTRAVEPGEAERAGRWWWESNAPKECGMHCSIEHGGFEHELKAILGK
ncbi:MAG TPA: phosphoadenylyl-sulfate reductase [Gaiellaceae bacterium]|jgi:phosphoadenosine phosphosulfate reductase